MKCVDAIEGTVKYILKCIHTLNMEDHLDDTDYARNAKAIIDGADRFIRDNPELIDDPQILKDVLFEYSRSLWLAGLIAGDAAQPTDNKEIGEEQQEYQTYYYDYIYHRGVYPR
ncbi:MAG: hypothetical protein KJP07_13230 [Desulfatitalea sp.]|nr:hypothetical protein [Desulfatitalea sp.]